MIRKIYRVSLFGVLLFSMLSLTSVSTAVSPPELQGPIVTIRIEGSINPATDDFLKTSLQHAHEIQASLFVIELNTPGGLLTSTQTMVETLLEAPIPTVVFVTPGGASATSAGVFITLAGHIAVMSPGTTIGAAAPVQGTGQDIDDAMKEKVENFAVSLIKAISEQRGRNAEWAESAVRKSVSVTDREAVKKKVVDFVATDLNDLVQKLEGREVSVKGHPVKLSGLSTSQRQHIEMSFKQKVVNVLSDPNIAILLGLGAMLGLGIEFYNPGLILPGVIGVICLVLSLTAGQVLPINYGGLALLILGFAFFIIEFFVPSFGIWGIAGTICFVLGSIYLIDTDLVWGVGSFEVDKIFIGSTAAAIGLLLTFIVYLVMRDQQESTTTGKEGFVGKTGTALGEFQFDSHRGMAVGKVLVMGEIWRAVAGEDQLPLGKGDSVRVNSLEEALTLRVTRV